MFRPVRYFIIVSVFSLIVVVMLSGHLYREVANSQIIELGKRENTALAQVLTNALQSSVLLGIREMQDLSASELRRHSVFKELDKTIRTHIKGTNTLKVEVFSLNGNTIYSTDMRQLGVNNKSNPAFKKALSGGVATQLNIYNHFYTLEGITIDRNIVTSYLPIYQNNNDEVVAIFELYSDVTKQISDINEIQVNVYAYAASITLIIFSIMFVVVSRADKHINQHRLQILEQEKEIERHAYRDALTGLPNRMLFQDRLNHAIKLTDCSENMLSVFFIDLDRFKNINDSLGHVAGDKILVKVSERLKQCVRDSDTVARFGGDEFVVLVEGISTVDEATESANRIIEAMKEHFIVDGHEVFLTLSIGIVFYPFENDGADSLLQKADVAVYLAKKAGRNTYRFYSPENSNDAVIHFSLENTLRRALEREELELYYQPMVHLKTGDILGVEALLRWNSSDVGLVSPAEFIPILEESGLILSVGQWVLETACEQAMKWQQLGIQDIKINVNVSAKQFRQKGFIRQVSNALESSGLQPHLLNLEITENLLIENTADSIYLLDKLNDMGVSLSIDDFGTGYSSMAYLKRLPIDILKIDQSFVRGVPDDAEDVAIIDAICAVSRSLRINVIAEGVENKAQFNFLKNLGITGVQGYLFSQPVPAKDLEEFLLGGKSQ